MKPTPLIPALFLALVAWLAVPFAAHAAENSLDSGDIVIANYRGAAGAVARINPISGVTRKLGGFSLPTDVALSSSGAMFVSQWDGVIKRLNLTNGLITTVTSSLPLSQVWGLVVGPGGDLFLTTSVSNRVMRLNPTTGVASQLTAGDQLDHPVGIALLDATHLVVASSLNNNIVSVSIADGTQTVLAPGAQGIDQPWGVAVFGDQTYIGAHDSTLLQVISGGAISPVAAMGATPVGIGVDMAGNITLGLSGGISGPFSLVRVSPQGGSLGTYSGPLIGEVAGLEIAPVSITAAAQVNTPPNITPVTSSININENTPLGFTVVASDTNWPLQNVTFSLDAGAPAGAAVTSAGNFSWSPTEAQGPGSYPITIRVTDSGTPSASSTTSFTVNLAEANLAPVLDVLTNRSLFIGETVAFTATATDADIPVQSLVFSLNTNAPAGATITTNGGFSWTPSPAQAPGTNLLTITVKDSGTPVLSHSRTFTIVVRLPFASNMPPMITPVSDRVVNEGSPLAINVVAIDTNQPPQTLTHRLAATPPAGVTFSTAGAFRWTPTEVQGPSTNSFAVIVSDNGIPSLSSTQAFTVVVNEVNSSPALAPLPDRTAREGVPLTFMVAVTDTDLPAQPLNFTLGPGAPAASSIDAAGIFSWTPAAADVLVTNTLSVRVTDNGTPSLSATQQFEIVTLPAISIRPGDILAADYGGGAVVCLRPSTGETRLVNWFTAPMDLALTTNSLLYVAEESGAIRRMDLSTGEVTTVNPLTTMASVWGLAFGPGGDLFATCNGTDSVMRINPATGEETVLSSGGLLTAPAGIDVMEGGDLVVASFNDASVTRIDISNGSQTALPTHPSITDAWGIAVSGTNVFVAGLSSEALEKISPQSAFLFATNLGIVRGVGLYTNGTVVLGVSGQGVGVHILSAEGSSSAFIPSTAVGPLSGLAIATSAIGNRPPSPAFPVLERYPLLGAKLRITSFLGGDPDGDTLTLISAGPSSPNGGQVRIADGWVFYTPAAGFTNGDTFAFITGDSFGATSAGTATVTLRADPAPTQNIHLEVLPGGTNRLSGDGIPGCPYTVEFSAGLNPASWQALTIVLPDATGAFEVLDTPPANAPVRFYRTVRP